MYDTTFVLLAGWTIASSCLSNPAVMGPAWKEIASDIQGRYPGRPLVVSEKWCSDPLEYYAKRTVEQSEAVTEKDLNEGAVFVCRPSHCLFIEQDSHLERVMTYEPSRLSDTSAIWVFDEK